MAFNFDSLIHVFFKHKDSLRWRNFPKIGLNESYYGYYYAEDELYIIRDGMTNMLYFVEAKSPKEAFMKFHDMMEEVI